MNKARTGPRSAARFKPEVYPRSAPQKCTPEVHPRSKLTKCTEKEDEELKLAADKKWS